jgi:DNA-binding beta-propeller fold protein YncE
MGLAAAAGSLWIADADSSSVRRMDFRSNGALSTPFGGDKVFTDNLFQYGDREGEGQSARFQYPSGAAAARAGEVLIADTYNHRLKLLATAPDVNRARNWAGSGRRGHRDGAAAAAQFNEPAGVAASPDAGRAWVVDAGNGCVRVVDLETREVSTLALTGVPAVDEAAAARAEAAALLQQ